MVLQRFADTYVDSTPGLVGTGSKLEIAEPGNTTSYTVVADVKALPAVGGAPQEIDVTTLADTRAKQLEGIQAASSMAFTVQYKGPSWNAIQPKANDRKQYNWRITYPDGMTATFTGSFSIQVAALATNAALTYTLTVSVSDGPDFSQSPTTGASNPS
ncbi:phage tail protein [Levilactobacillus bambusae]|nr:phage tail protein [Levilactobacillus bambusae]